MHDAHLALSELALILLRDEDHDHVLDELSLRLSKLHLTVCYAEVHRDRSCDRLCGNELRLLCAAQRSAELLGDHHPGTNGRNLDDHDLLEDGHYLDDRDPLADDPPNHHGYKTVYPHDHRDLLTDGHCLDGRDLLVDDLLNHHDHTTDDHRDLRDLLTDDHYLDDRDLLVDDPLNHHEHTTDDHRDLLTDDHDLGHHFARMQDDLLDDYLDGMGVRHDLMPRGRDYLLDGRDCPTDDPGLRLVCLNDHRHRRDALDAKVCQILLPVADDVDRDFLGLAPDEVYLQTTRKQRTYERCD